MKLEKRIAAVVLIAVVALSAAILTMSTASATTYSVPGKTYTNEYYVPSGTTFIRYIGVYYDSNDGDAQQGVKDGYYNLIGKNLNAGAGGKKIYAGYKTTTDPDAALNDLKVLKDSDSPDNYTYNSKTYYAIGTSQVTDPSYLLDGKLDLNKGAGGSYIYFYASTSFSAGVPITAITIDTTESQSGWETVKFMGTNAGESADLNKGAGGDYIYAHIQRMGGVNTSTLRSAITRAVNEYNALTSAEKTKYDAKVGTAFNAAVNIINDYNGTAGSTSSSDFGWSNSYSQSDITIAAANLNDAVDLGLAAAKVSGKFYVPEMIYLTPATSGAKTFQYYADCGTDGTVTSNVAGRTEGTFYFKYDKATSITSIKCSGATINGVSQNNELKSKASISGNTATLTIKSGSGTCELSSGINPGNYSQLTWTVEYTADLNGDGSNETYTAKNYTQCYAPLITPMSGSVAGRYDSSNSDKKSYGAITVWATGIHSITSNGTTNDGYGAYKHKPLVSGSTVPTAGDKNFSNVFDTFKSGLGGGAYWASDSNAEYDFAQGTLCVDKSRISNYKNVPNLLIGLDNNYRYGNGTSGKYSRLGYYETNTETASGTTDQRLWYADTGNNNSYPSEFARKTLDRDVSTTRTTEQFNIRGFSEFKGSHWNCSTRSSCAHIFLNVTISDKSDIREHYNDTLGANYQEVFYKHGSSSTQGTWEYYITALGNESSNLDKVTSTTVDTSTLTTAASKLTLKQTTLTVDLAGGSWTNSATSFTQNVRTSVALPVPTKTGYVFTGWSRGGDKNGLIFNDSNSCVSGIGGENTGSGTFTYKFWPKTSDVTANTATDTLTATWRKAVYNIQYDLNGGTLPHAFDYESTNGGNPQQGNPTVVWYDGTYKNNKQYDQWIRIDTPTRTGYTFNGWTVTGMDSCTHHYWQNSTNNTSTATSWSGFTANEMYNLSATDNAVVTFTANWTVNKYTFSYNANGGKLTNNLLYFSDGSMSVEDLTNGNFTDIDVAKANDKVSISGTVGTGASGTGEICTNVLPLRMYLVKGKTYSFTLTVPTGRFCDSEFYFFCPSATEGTQYSGAREPERFGSYPYTTSNSAGFEISSTFNSSTGVATGTFKPVCTGVYQFRFDQNIGGKTFSSPFNFSITDFVVTEGAENLGVEHKIEQNYDTVVSIPNPQRTGYSFSSWTQDGTSATISNNAFNVPAGNLKLTANWTPITYTVKYNGNGNTGGSTASSTHTYNTAKALTSNGFTKAGYTFAGWATTTTGNVAYTNGQSVTNLASTQGAEVNLYAKWTPIKYTVKYDMNNSNAPKNNLFVPKVVNTSQNGLTVTYDSATGIFTVNGTQTASTGTMYYAPYAFQSGKTYRLSVIKVGGSKTAGNGCLVIDRAASEGGNTSTRQQLDFNDANASKTIDYVSDAVGLRFWIWHNSTANVFNNLQFKVKFEENSSQTDYTPSGFQATYDTNFTLPTVTLAGYTFNGWAESASGSVKYNAGASVKNLTSASNGEVTLYAKWTINKYALTINPNGGTWNSSTSNSTVKGNYQSSTAIADPTRNGYTFQGWEITKGNDTPTS